jgi:rare lipoprotein A (peptidoglycan hydrolase)
VVAPLLLLATPQRATLHGSRHHTVTPRGRVRVQTLTRFSTAWTIPVAFADLIRTVSGPTTSPSNEVATAPADPAPHTRVENASYRQPLSPTNTALPTTTAPPTTTRKMVAPPVATTTPKLVAPAPRPAPATAAPVASAPPPAPSHISTGQASWYGAPAGTCASPSLAFGTVLTITDLSTGASVRCTVDDRQAWTQGRVVDLSEATFIQLASAGVGVIEVRLTW